MTKKPIKETIHAKGFDSVIQGTVPCLECDGLM